MKPARKRALMMASFKQGELHAQYRYEVGVSVARAVLMIIEARRLGLATDFPRGRGVSGMVKLLAMLLY